MSNSVISSPQPTADNEGRIIRIACQSDEEIIKIIKGYSHTRRELALRIINLRGKERNLYEESLRYVESELMMAMNLISN